MRIHHILLVLLIVIIPKNFINASENVVFIHTDRYCYVSGDVVFFKIYFPENILDQTGKQTIYVDLITSDKHFICGELIKTFNGIASGYLNIPDTLLSGKYDLRVYTDISIKSQHPVLGLKHLYISNRFGKEGDVMKMFLLDTIKSGLPGKEFDNPVCSVNIANTKFHKREKVNIEVLFHPTTVPDTLYTSLSIKPISPFEQLVESENNHIDNLGNLKSNKQNSRISEVQGIKIGGKLINAASQDPVLQAIVFLSFEDTILRIKYDIVDEKGDFCFFIDNFYGNQTAILTAFSYPDLHLLNDVMFNINDLFYKEPVTASTTNFFRGISYDTLNISKAIVSKAYNINYVKFKDIPIRDTFLYENKHFTGRLTSQVYPDDYVVFNDFIELAREILPIIRYKKTGNTYRVSIIDPVYKTARSDPFVLVDGIPLGDVSKIKDLGTGQIKRIDMKSQPRFYGDVFMPNGILLIWTKNKEFWLYKTFEYCSKQEFKLYQKPVDIIFPDYSLSSSKNLPDFRQTLFWEPQLEITNNTPSEVSFYTSDEIGQYEVILEGISQKGLPVFVRKVFTVE